MLQHSVIYLLLLFVFQYNFNYFLFLVVLWFGFLQYFSFFYQTLYRINGRVTPPLQKGIISFERFVFV